MPVIQPDTSAAIEMGNIEPGTYPCKLSAVEYKTSSKGNPMLKITTEVMVEGKSRTRFANLVISGPGSGGFDQLLRATGFADLADKYKDPNQANPDFDTDSLIGQECNVMIDSQMYQGTLRDNVKGFVKA